VNPPLLEIERLSAGYGAKPVLADVRLTITRGERAALLGPSGSGKSTLLRCIAGLTQPREGSIRINGELVADARTSVAAARRGVAMVFQSYALWPHLTAREHVRFVAGGNERADAWLDRVRIGALAQRLPGQLSGGEQARLALARAFATGAKLLLLDEPLRNLDPPLAAELRAELVRWIDESGATALLVTHEPRDAVELATVAHVLVSVDGCGRLGASGPPQALLDAPPDDAVARVLGRSRRTADAEVGA
jgi:ABC-type Fe3+/spermidine/putrescine transport system ATPase subunit